MEAYRNRIGDALAKVAYPQRDLFVCEDTRPLSQRYAVWDRRLRFPVDTCVWHVFL